jgi:putative lipoic acid-binding regulatory protein
MSPAPDEDFPCEFPIKVMGRQDGDIRRESQAIIEKHIGPVTPAMIRVRSSTDGNFLALTYLIHAESRAQVDLIYRELTACKSVLMAL